MEQGQSAHASLRLGWRIQGDGLPGLVRRKVTSWSTVIPETEPRRAGYDQLLKIPRVAQAGRTGRPAEAMRICGSWKREGMGRDASSLSLHDPLTASLDLALVTRAVTWDSGSSFRPWEMVLL